MTERHFISIRDRRGGERTVRLTGPTLIGRQSHCEIVLSDSLVSREHLRVEPVGENWWVEDLDSSYGSFVGEDRIERMVWESGVTLRLADGAYYLTLKTDQAFATELNLQAVLQTAHLLSGKTELDDLLEQTLERLLGISGTDRGFIMLPEGGNLEVKVRRNLSENMEKDIHLSSSSVRRVFEQGAAIWIHNVATDEMLAAQQSILDLQLKTIFCLPLVVRTKCIGVVYLDSRRVAAERVDRATFEAIVSLCAIAIERARIFEENIRNQVLATAKKIVEEHAGTIEVASEEGCGTTVTIWLPDQPPSAAVQ